MSEETEEIRYMLRGQRPLDAMSLVRIPFAVVVLVVVTGVLAVLGMRITLVRAATPRIAPR